MFAFGFRQGCRPLISAALAFAHMEAASLVARMAAPPADARKSLIDQAIGQLKMAGVWGKLDVLQIFAGHDAQAACLNWKGPAHDASVAAGAPVFVADRGWFVDGVADRIAIGFAPAQGTQFVQNAACFAVVPGERTIAHDRRGHGNGQRGGHQSADERGYDRVAAQQLGRGHRRHGGERLWSGRGRPGVGLGGAALPQRHGRRRSGDGGERSAGDRRHRAWPLQWRARVQPVPGGVLGGHLTDAEHQSLHDALAGYLTAVGVAESTDNLSDPAIATVAPGSAVTLPNGAPATTGKGWTCTGLAPMPDGGWMVGNDGRGEEGDPNLCSIVHVATDFGSILHQWTTAALGLPEASVQGIAWEQVGADGVRGHAWIVLATATRMIVKLTIADDWTASVAASFAGPADANGLAIDTRRDELILLCNGATTATLRWYGKAGGVTERSFALIAGPGGTNYDMLAYDAAADEVFVSYGVNGQVGRIERWRVVDDFGGLWKICQDILTGADAIEGIAIDGGDYVVLNDAYFYPGTPALNRVLRYARPA